MADDKIDNWHGKPIGELSRGELIDALDWCVKEMRRRDQERMILKLNPFSDRDSRKCTGR